DINLYEIVFCPSDEKISIDLKRLSRAKTALATFPTLD
ncbi:unnamed protein product, partial [Rotaria sordida]